MVIKSPAIKTLVQLYHASNRLILYKNFIRTDLSNFIRTESKVFEEKYFKYSKVLDLQVEPFGQSIGCIILSWKWPNWCTFNDDYWKIPRLSFWSRHACVRHPWWRTKPSWPLFSPTFFLLLFSFYFLFFSPTSGILRKLIFF